MPLARVTATRGGLSFDHKRRLFVIDYADLPPGDEMPTPEVKSSAGEISNVVARTNPVDGNLRVSFELDPGDAALVELRLTLMRASGPASETWLYRWTSA